MNGPVESGGRGVGPLACDRLGAGPVVVLVHGVGIGPWSYDAMAAALATDHTVVVPHRRGYGGSAGLPPASSLDEQVDDLAATVDGPARFVGVSGGATLVLALAMARPDLVAAAVVHEPVFGPLSGALHAELGSAGAGLARSDGAVAFVRRLVGDSLWGSLDQGRRDDVARVEATVRHEVPQFLGFAPGPERLRAAGAVGVVTTVGGDSRPSRHHAANVLAGHLGRPATVLPGVGHLAQMKGVPSLVAALRQAEALQGRAGGDQDVLAPRGGHEL